MKNLILPFIALLFVGTSVAIGFQSCKKETCYDCEKNAATHVNYGYAQVCGEADKNDLQSRGYICTDNGMKKRKKH